MSGYKHENTEPLISARQFVLNSFLTAVIFKLTVKSARRFFTMFAHLFPLHDLISPRCVAPLPFSDRRAAQTRFERSQSESQRSKHSVRRSSILVAKQKESVLHVFEHNRFQFRVAGRQQTLV